MQLTINTSSASAAIAYVMPACKKSTLPILENILIEPDGNNIKFTAFNMEIELSSVAACNWSEPASITVEGKKLADIFKQLPKDTDANVTIKDSKLVIKCGRSRFTLTTLPAQGFPSFYDDHNINAINCDSGVLRKAIDRCAVVMPSNDVRHYLNGLHFNISSGTMDIVCTDGHRMNMDSITTESKDVSVTIPNGAVKSVAAIMGSGNVSLKIGENSLSATDTSRTVKVKLVDGKYPDYKRVIPKANDILVEFNRQELISAVNRSLLLSNDKQRGITMTLGDNQCVVAGSNALSEQSEDVIPCTHSSPELMIGFNGDYLLDALGSVTSDSVVLEFGSGQAAVMIQDGDFKAIVMPLRM